MILVIMPRSNKKKPPQKPPPKHPAGSDEMMHFSTAMSSLITSERDTMRTTAKCPCNHMFALSDASGTVLGN